MNAKGAADGPQDPVVYVMKDAFDGALITTVFHEEDGDWQYLTAAEPTLEAAQLSHQSHVHELDPTLHELMDMPRGTWAVRQSRGGPWTFGEDDE